MFRYLCVSVSILNALHCKTHILILFTQTYNLHVASFQNANENVMPENLECGLCGRHSYAAAFISLLVDDNFQNDNMEKLVLVSVKEFTEICY